jgi:hypothetical protein
MKTEDEFNEYLEFLKSDCGRHFCIYWRMINCGESSAKGVNYWCARISTGRK